MATARQIAANQLNALKSTGPTSEEGKLASRANALKHGLTAEVVVPEGMAAAIAERRACWWASLGAGAADLDDAKRVAWITEVIATETVKMDRCQAELEAIEARRAGSAATRWHEDRRLLAEELAVKLPRNPALISRQLQATRHGCQLLIDRWNGLKSALNVGEWTQSQRSHAFDLLGIHPDLRAGVTILELPLTAHGPASESDLIAHRIGFINHEVARLNKQIETSLEALDDFDRGQAEMGHVLLSDKDIHRLNRYEKECWKKYLWALRELRTILGEGPSGKTAKVNPTAPKLTLGDRHVRDLAISTQKLLEGASELNIEVETPRMTLREIRAEVEPSRPMNRRRRRALAAMDRRG